MFLRKNSIIVMIYCMDMLVLWGNVGSLNDLCLTVLKEGSRGTEVNRALTSYDVIISHGSSFNFCMCYLAFLQFFLQEKHPGIHTMLPYANYGYKISKNMVSLCINMCK